MIIFGGGEDFVIILMLYKQNANNARGGYAVSSATRIDDERKLMKLWKEEQVSEDYQSVVLQYFDQFQDKTQLHQQIQLELKRTYEHETAFFRIERLLAEREKTLDKLEKEAGLLEKFKNESYRREPNLQPICMLIDHIRKVHLLISEQVYEMFNLYGHPRAIKTGYTYLNLFKTLNDDIQFLNASLMKYYMPFSPGFDPLFLELVQKLRKCYGSEMLVYNQSVQELINLNASYLYRLLRAHQRILEFISIADERDEYEAAEFTQNNRVIHQDNRSLLEPIAEEHKLPSVQTERTDRYEPPRREYQSVNYRFSTPKQTDTSQHYPISISVSPKPDAKMRVEKTSEYKIQARSPSRAPEYRIQPSKIVNQKLPNGITSNKDFSLALDNSFEIQKSQVKTPRKPNVNANLPKHEELKPLTLSRKMLGPKVDMKTLANQRDYHKRSKTEESTITRNIATIHESKAKFTLPKLKDSRTAASDSHGDCECRKRYKQKHLDHSDCEPTEQQVYRRRNLIIRDVQSKYKALALKQMRHQLSKLGGITYHKLRNMKNSRIHIQKGKLQA